MPFTSLKAAEKAAIEGNLEDLDTQACQLIQNTLYSDTPDHVASDEVKPDIDAEEEQEGDDEETEDEENEVDANDNGNEGNAVADVALSKSDSLRNPGQFVASAESKLVIENGTSNEPSTIPSVVYRRDEKGKLRAYKGTVEHRPLDFEEQHQMQRELADRRYIMDDLTQRTSMSPTQENTSSAYTRFDIQQVIREEFPSTAGPDYDEEQATIPNAPYDSTYSKQYASVHTESTAFTYQENDTGHVKLDFAPDVIEEEVDEEEPLSQDESFAPQDSLPFEPAYPQTPAPPKNPFSNTHKGSVMKGSDMFGATQPSSIARRVASPAPTLPSPNVYDDFTSPAKRQRTGSSPLTRLRDSTVAAETSPLQSSVRDMLGRSISEDFLDNSVPRRDGVRSFNSVPSLSRNNSLPEPRVYVSMNQSQERRNRSPARKNDNIYDSDSDIEFRDKKKERKLKALKELSSVALPPHRTQGSTRPNSSNTPAIEVPSTGKRRRSVQEEYIPQCSGHDARDTQQDDVIADSQGPADRSNEQDESRSSTERIRDSGIEEADSVPTASTSRVAASSRAHSPSKQVTTPQRAKNGRSTTPDRNSPGAVAAHDAGDQTESGLSVQDNERDEPLQASKSPKDTQRSNVADTVPETSPPEGRIRPMREIANLSFNETPIDMDDVPGFSPDVDFDDAMRIDSPKLPTRRRNRSKALLVRAHSSLQEIVKEVASSSASLSDIPSTVRCDDGADIEKPTSPVAPQAENGISVMPDEAEVQEPDLPTVPLSDIDIPTVPDEVAIKERLDAADIPELEVRDETKEGPSPEQEDISMQNESNRITIDQNENMHDDQGDDMQKLAGDETGEETDVNMAHEESEQIKEPAFMNSPTPKRKSATKGKTYLTGRAPSSRSDNNPVIDPIDFYATKTPTTGVLPASTPLSSALSTPLSSARSTPQPEPFSRPTPQAGPSLRSTRSQAGLSNHEKESTPALAPKKTTQKNSGPISVQTKDHPTSSTRTSRRQTMTNLSRDGSEDPLALTPTSTHNARLKKAESTLFDKMAFAVSYVDEQERDKLTKLIPTHGGRILEGFDALFNSIPKSSAEDIELSLSNPSHSLGFTALIADEHSRKLKYMQALALGLPCLSGRWISACVSKSTILDWTPYLLCAGLSTFLGNAIRSRILQPYAASEAQLVDTLSGRTKLLQGKSILMVTGKGKTAEKRKTFMFLTKALGPSRVGQAVDYVDARKCLVEAEKENQSYDMLLVENRKDAEKIVFAKSTPTSNGTKKRKRGPADAETKAPAPKKIRTIEDETIIQSLILGQLLEADDV